MRRRTHFEVDTSFRAELPRQSLGAAVSIPSIDGAVHDPELHRLMAAPITAVYWAPMFEGPLSVSHECVAPYYAAYSALAGFICDAESERRWMVTFRLEPGEVTIFDNRRMLHGRTAFSQLPGTAAQGEAPQRLLQGCYVSADDWTSRLMTLRAQAEGSTDEWPDVSRRRS